MPNRTNQVLDCLDAIGALGLVHPGRVVAPPRWQSHSWSDPESNWRDVGFGDIAVDPPDNGRDRGIGRMLEPIQSESEIDRAERHRFLEKVGPIGWDGDMQWSPDRPLQSAAVVDADAWYSPIHVYASDWGIYIKSSAITRIAADLMWVASSLGFRDKCVVAGAEHEFVRAAALTLFHHEVYHHMVESFIINMAILLKDGGRWEHYHRNVYLRQLGRDIGPNEEALANAYQLRRASRASLPDWVRKSLVTYLPAAFAQQGPGYSRGAVYASDQAFTSLERFLMSEIETGPFTGARRPSSSWLPFGMVTPLLDCKARIYLWPA